MKLKKEYISMFLVLLSHYKKICAMNEPLVPRKEEPGTKDSWYYCGKCLCLYCLLVK